MVQQNRFPSSSSSFRPDEFPVHVGVGGGWRMHCRAQLSRARDFRAAIIRCAPERCFNRRDHAAGRLRCRPPGGSGNLVEVAERPETGSTCRLRRVTGNYDLQIAVARLQEAREVEYVNGGGALPGVGGTPGIEMVGAAGRSSGNDALRGRLGGPVYSGVDTSSVKEVTHAIGFDSGWELDLFGRYTRLIEASNADTQAAAEFRNDVLITVVADVVRAYTDVRSSQLRLEIARENAASEERMLRLVTIRFNGGLTNELDVALAQRQLSTTLSRIAPLEAEISAAERRTAVLCGQYPDELRGELEKAAPLPATPPSVAPGMPVNLLRRRPDIRQAERQLAAATARIGLATANLFPRVSITAGAGLQGSGTRSHAG